MRAGKTLGPVGSSAICLAITVSMFLTLDAQRAPVSMPAIPLPSNNVALGTGVPTVPGSPALVPHHAGPGVGMTAQIAVPANANDPVFASIPTYGSGGRSAMSEASGDFNNDGNPDIVVANQCIDYNCTTGALGVLLNNGDGTYQSAVTYSSGGTYAFAVAVGDLNGDGKPDLVAANYFALGNSTLGSIGVMLGNGDGTFQPVVNYNSTGQYSYSVAIGDLNADGKPDVVVANQCNTCGPGRLSIFLGNGDGTLQAATSYDSGAPGALWVSIADLNGDGKPDLAVANQCLDNQCQKGSVGVLLGNGNGTFQAAIVYSSGAYYASQLAVVDLNGDGTLDLVVLNQEGGTTNFADGAIGVLLGVGNGTFQPVVNFDSGGQIGRSVYAADVNGDSYDDLIVANAQNGISVLLGIGDGSFHAGVNYGTSGFRPYGALFLDANKDGIGDIIAMNNCDGAGCGAGSVSMLFGKPNGGFASLISYPTGGQNGYLPAIADLNGDGKLDVVVPSNCGDLCTNGSVSVFLGHGDGTFEDAADYASGGQNAQAVQIADLNGDSVADLVVANACSAPSCNGLGAVGILLGNGDGTFQAPLSFSSAGGDAVSVAISDVNGDGKPDIVASNYCYCSASTVGVLIANGDGTFQSPVSYLTGGARSYSVLLADFDGDGKADIAVANSCAQGNDCSSGVIGVLINKGDGSYNPVKTFNPGGQYLYAAAIGDLNHDGNLDLIAANQCSTLGCANGGSVGVLLGDGQGAFQPAKVISTAPISGFQSSLVTADVDGDGNQDVLSAAGNMILLGNGDGTLQAPILLGAGGYGLAVGDFNQDGKPDAAVTGGNIVTILLNTSTAKAKATTTTLTSDVNPSVFSQPVTLTATVNSSGSGTPTGSVTFNDGSNVLGTGTLSNGTASFTTSALSVSSHSITATYGGDTNFNGSTSPTLNQAVNQAPVTLALASTPNPASYAQAVTISVSITPQFGGQASGTVLFEDNGAALGTVSLINNVASLSTNTLSVGQHSLVASYSGDTNFQGSVSTPVSQVVTQAATTATLVSSPDPSAFGQSVTFVSTVVGQYGGTPTGSVAFMAGTRTLGSAPLSNGQASFVLMPPSVGNYMITAVYSGDPNFGATNSAAVQQKVLKAGTSVTVTSSKDPSHFGDLVTFTASIAGQYGGTPSGTVTFKDGTTVLGTVTLSGGSAQYSTSSLTKGLHRVVGFYSGDTNFKTSSGGVTQKVQ